MHKAVELVASEQQNLSERTDKSLSEQDKRLLSWSPPCRNSWPPCRARAEASSEDSRKDYRQRAPGGDAPAGTLTNC